MFEFLFGYYLDADKFGISEFYQRGKSKANR